MAPKKARKKGINGRTKGSSFERLAAKDICEAGCVGREHCYRTPLSGGHPFGDAGDLTVTETFRKRFPFVIECKHRANWKPGVMFDPRKQERDWMHQVIDAQKRVMKRLKQDYIPLMIIRGNGTDVFAAWPAVAYDLKVPLPTLRFKGVEFKGSKTWRMCLLSDFLERHFRNYAVSKRV